MSTPIQITLQYILQKFSLWNVTLLLRYVLERLTVALLNIQIVRVCCVRRLAAGVP